MGFRQKSYVLGGRSEPAVWVHAYQKQKSCWLNQGGMGEHPKAIIAVHSNKIFLKPYVGVFSVLQSSVYLGLLGVLTLEGSSHPGRGEAAGKGTTSGTG